MKLFILLVFIPVVFTWETNQSHRMSRLIKGSKFLGGPQILRNQPNFMGFELPEGIFDELPPEERPSWYKPSKVQPPTGRPQPSGVQRPGGRPQPSGVQRPGGRPQPSGGQRPGGRPQPSGGQRPGGRPQPSGVQRPGGRPQPSGKPRPNSLGGKNPSGRPRPSGSSKLSGGFLKLPGGPSKLPGKSSKPPGGSSNGLDKLFINSMADNSMGSQTDQFRESLMTLNENMEILRKEIWEVKSAMQQEVDALRSETREIKNSMHNVPKGYNKQKDDDSPKTVQHYANEYYEKIDNGNHIFIPGRHIESYDHKLKKSS